MEKIKATAAFIKQQTNNFSPKYGIILGTGLGSLINDVDIEYSLSYEDIPNFPISTVEVHEGKLVFGKLEGQNIVVMQGRFHYYEGYDMQQITFPVRVMKLLGIEKLFVSNAAGGINPSYQLSDLMVLSDHINLLPENPLRGKNMDELGPRWPDMFDTYDKNMISQAVEVGINNGFKVNTGVYASVPGPNLETPAEYKYLEIIGADAVGMSTVPEVIVARHMGLPVFAVSVITDLCYPGALEPVNIEKILAAAYKAEPNMTFLIKQLITS